MDPAQEIKQRIDIVEFIGSYIPVKKLGRNFKAVCPFHTEKTPSFVISPERQIWHCFGSCQEGGDVIKFLMKWENITFPEALKELAKKAGVTLNISSYEDKVYKRTQRILQANAIAADYFEFVLLKTAVGKNARTYLADRAINDKVAHTFQLGYAPQSWDSLLKFLKTKKFTEEEIASSELTVRGKGGRLYDRFRGRLMFPIKDARNNTIGFSGRVLDPEVKESKYINTPESAVYHKRESLFGINIAKDSIKKTGFAIIVEGEFDVITPFEHGIANIVAIKGSALTIEHLTLLKRFTNRIVFCLDADATGIEAVRRGSELAQQFDFEIEVVTLENAKDPDEAVRTNAEAFKKAIKHRVPVYDFLLTALQKQYGTEDPYAKKKIVDEFVPQLGKIRNPIVQSHYIKTLSHSLDVSESSIMQAIRNHAKAPRAKPFVTASDSTHPSESRDMVTQKYLLSILFQGGAAELNSQIFEILDPDDFTNPSFSKLFQLFREFSGTQQFSQTIPAELLAVYDELFLFATFEDSFAHDNILRLAFEVKRYALKRHIARVTGEGDEIGEHQHKGLQQYTSQLKEVEKKLSTL